MSDHKKELLAYLQSQNLMALATKADEFWVSTVYYVSDSDCNLYYLSEPTTIHGRQITTNPEVVCAITDSHQKVTDKKIGVQLRGTAAGISNVGKLQWMLAMWNKINPGFESVINLHNIQHRVINSKVYVVKPQIIKFFNEALYGPEGFELFEFSQ